MVVLTCLTLGVGVANSADDMYTRLLAKLSAYSRTKIGAVGAGPVLASEDTRVAEKLTELATAAQLKELLVSKNPAVRAHVARQIIRRRPKDVALVDTLLTDATKITVGSMSDTPPIRNRKMSIAALIREELAIAGLQSP